MSEIRNGDVVYYKNDGRGHKFEGNLYVLSTRGNSCVGKDEAGKTHIFSTTNLLTTAIPTGLHFADEDEFFEHFQNKENDQGASGDMTRKEILDRAREISDRRFPTSNGDVRLTLISTKNEKRSGQIALTILNVFPEFDKNNRYMVVPFEELNRIYVFKATEKGEGYKVQTISSHPRISFTDLNLYEKLKSEGRMKICLNWKEDLISHWHYISLEEESV